MTSLKIRIFKGNDKKPETTVTIPIGILKIASKLIPKQAASILDKKGIDINQILELSKKDVKGTLIEIEDHKKKEKVIIAIE
jgi:hypothetical protein